MKKIFFIIFKIINSIKKAYNKINNRLLASLIVSIFLLFGTIYYYKIDKNPKYNNTKKQNNFSKVLNKNQKFKKAKLVETQNKNIIFDNNKQEIEKNIIKKLNIKISKILKNKNLKITKINWTENLFLIESENKNYIFDNKISNLKKIDLNLKINYAKKINYKIFFITEKWPFILDKNQNFSFFASFDDFVIDKNQNYIWIIKNNEIQKKKNFGFENTSWNLIILFSPQKSIKKLLYKANFEIKKILLENNQVILEDSLWKKYLLDY